MELGVATGDVKTSSHRHWVVSVFLGQSLPHASHKVLNSCPVLSSNLKHLDILRNKQTNKQTNKQPIVIRKELEHKLSLGYPLDHASRINIYH